MESDNFKSKVERRKALRLAAADHCLAILFDNHSTLASSPQLAERERLRSRDHLVGFLLDPVISQATSDKIRSFAERTGVDDEIALYGTYSIIRRAQDLAPEVGVPADLVEYALQLSLCLGDTAIELNLTHPEDADQLRHLHDSQPLAS